MNTARPLMKWWGWGSPDVSTEPSEELLHRLRLALGCDFPRQIPDRRPPRLPAKRPVTACGGLRTDDATRLQFAAGRSYIDLIRLRRGQLIEAPDAVASPASADEIRPLLRQRASAVVPYGGGTSVVGGVAARRGKHDSVIVLDTSNLNRVLALDAESMTIRVEAGMFGPELERHARAAGLTLGHFPQSFEYSTVGGWIAARSAGQESTRYGSIEDVVTAVTMLAPSGDIATKAVPRSATGPELRDLVVGSEGAFGVITDATLRLHRIARRRVYRSYLFRTFEEGVDAVRELLQSAPTTPAVLRLSDETETQLAFDVSRTSPAVQSLLHRFGRAPGAHLLLGFDDAAPQARPRGGLPLGGSPGKKWSRERFSHPYMRDTLIDYGVFVETFETATSWSNLLPLYRGITGTLRGVVAVHLSHAYTDGASLYFTVFDAPPRGGEEAFWDAFKKQATDAIVACGGTISHHHGIGVDHKAWLRTERGSLGLQLLGAMKRELDPDEIMNPEKLL